MAWPIQRDPLHGQSGPDRVGATSTCRASPVNLIDTGLITTSSSGTSQAETANCTFDVDAVAYCAQRAFIEQLQKIRAFPLNFRWDDTAKSPTRILRRRCEKPTILYHPYPEIGVIDERNCIS